jgi:hypothetical protein
MAKANKTEVVMQLGNLRKWFPRGSTVYTILRHVSRSGMSRDISVVALNADGDKIVDIHPNYAVSVVTGRRARRGGMFDSIVCNGCGMDMGFDLVYSISCAVHGDGYALKHRWL